MSVIRYRQLKYENFIDVTGPVALYTGSRSIPKQVPTQSLISSTRSVTPLTLPLLTPSPLVI
jgi:hypothetical protein